MILTMIIIRKSHNNNKLRLTKRIPIENRKETANLLLLLCSFFRKGITLNRYLKEETTAIIASNIQKKKSESSFSFDCEKETAYTYTHTRIFKSQIVNPIMLLADKTARQVDQPTYVNSNVTIFDDSSNEYYLCVCVCTWFDHMFLFFVYKQI